MYHFLRSLHRWAGLISSIFILLIAATGFLLATKGSFGWVRPPEQKGSEISSLSETVTLLKAAEAAYAHGNPHIKTIKDIDRIDYRPKSNIFKIVSKEGYQEIQVDGATGEVLSVAFRTDQLAEDLHDLSYFSDGLHTYWLPIIAILLFTLGCSGIWIFFVPIYRRFKYKRLRTTRND